MKDGVGFAQAEGIIEGEKYNHIVPSEVCLRSLLSVTKSLDPFSLLASRKIFKKPLHCILEEGGRAK